MMARNVCHNRRERTRAEPKARRLHRKQPAGLITMAINQLRGCGYNLEERREESERWGARLIDGGGADSH